MCWLVLVKWIGNGVQKEGRRDWEPGLCLQVVTGQVFIALAVLFYGKARVELSHGTPQDAVTCHGKTGGYFSHQKNTRSHGHRHVHV